ERPLESQVIQPTMAPIARPTPNGNAPINFSSPSASVSFNPAVLPALSSHSSKAVQSEPQRQKSTTASPETEGDVNFWSSLRENASGLNASRTNPPPSTGIIAGFVH